MGKVPDLRNEVVELLWERMNRMCPNVTCVAGCGYGGAPLVSVMGSAYDIENCVIRDAPKRDGSLIEGQDLSRNDRLVIIDDVLTTGKSLADARQAIEQTGANVLGYLVIVDRGEYDRNIFDPDRSDIPLGYLYTPKDFGLK